MTISQCSAKSVAKPVYNIISSKHSGAVHSVFEHSFNLLIADQIIGIVISKFGNSPYNILLDHLDASQIAVGMSVKISNKKIFIGADLVIDLTLAEIWNPEILTENFDWKVAAENLQELVKAVPTPSPCLKIITEFFSTWTPSCDGVTKRECGVTRREYDTTLPLSPHRHLSPRRMTGSTNPNHLEDEMEILLTKKILNFLEELFAPKFSAEKFAASVDSLVGLGSGLTPSGDDFLAGVVGIFHNFLRFNHAENKIQTITKILDQTIISALNNSKTNLISNALLTAALHGWFAEKVSNFLLVLGDKKSSDSQKKNAMNQVLSIGHSSGRDMLAGICVAFTNLTPVALKELQLKLTNSKLDGKSSYIVTPHLLRGLFCHNQ